MMQILFDLWAYAISLTFLIEVILKVIFFGIKHFKTNFLLLFDALTIIVFCFAGTFIIRLGVSNGLVDLMNLGQGAYNFFRFGRVLRMLNIMSLVEKLRQFPVFADLDKLIRGLRYSFNTLIGTVLCILLLSFTCGAVMCCYLGQVLMSHSLETIEQNFGSVWKVANVLNQIAFLDGAQDLIEPMAESSQVSWVALMSFCFFSAFLLLNLIMAVIVNQAMVYTEKDKEHKALEIVKEKARYTKQVVIFFNKIDVNDDKKLSFDEFQKAFVHPEIRNDLLSVGVEMNELRELFFILDTMDSGELAIADFVTGMKRIRGNATTRDIITISQSIKRVFQQLLLIRQEYNRRIGRLSGLIQNRPFVIKKLKELRRSSDETCGLIKKILYQVKGTGGGGYKSKKAYPPTKSKMRHTNPAPVGSRQMKKEGTHQATVIDPYLSSSARTEESEQIFNRDTNLYNKRDCTNELSTARSIKKTSNIVTAPRHKDNTIESSTRRVRAEMNSNEIQNDIIPQEFTSFNQTLNQQHDCSLLMNHLTHINISRDLFEDDMFNQLDLMDPLRKEFFDDRILNIECSYNNVDDQRYDGISVDTVNDGGRTRVMNQDQIFNGILNDGEQTRIVDHGSKLDRSCGDSTFNDEQERSQNLILDRSCDDSKFQEEERSHEPIVDKSSYDTDCENDEERSPYEIVDGLQIHEIHDECDHMIVVADSIFPIVVNNLLNENKRDGVSGLQCDQRSHIAIDYGTDLGTMENDRHSDPGSEVSSPLLLHSDNVSESSCSLIHDPLADKKDTIGYPFSHRSHVKHATWNLMVDDVIEHAMIPIDVVRRTDPSDPEEFHTDETLSHPSQFFEKDSDTVRKGTKDTAATELSMSDRTSYNSMNEIDDGDETSNSSFDASRKNDTYVYGTYQTSKHDNSNKDNFNEHIKWDDNTDGMTCEHYNSNHNTVSEHVKWDDKNSDEMISDSDSSSMSNDIFLKEDVNGASLCNAQAETALNSHTGCKKQRVLLDLQTLCKNNGDCINPTVETNESKECNPRIMNNGNRMHFPNTAGAVKRKKKVLKKRIKTGPKVGTKNDTEEKKTVLAPIKNDDKLLSRKKINDDSFDRKVVKKNRMVVIDSEEKDGRHTIHESKKNKNGGEMLPLSQKKDDDTEIDLSRERTSIPNRAHVSKKRGLRKKKKPQKYKALWKAEHKNDITKESVERIEQDYVIVTMDNSIQEAAEDRITTPGVLRQKKIWKKTSKKSINKQKTTFNEDSEAMEQCNDNHPTIFRNKKTSITQPGHTRSRKRLQRRTLPTNKLSQRELSPTTTISLCDNPIDFDDGVFTDGRSSLKAQRKRKIRRLMSQDPQCRLDRISETQSIFYELPGFEDQDDHLNYAPHNMDDNVLADTTSTENVVMENRYNIRMEGCHHTEYDDTTSDNSLDENTPQNNRLEIKVDTSLHTYEFKESDCGSRKHQLPLQNGSAASNNVFERYFVSPSKTMFPTKTIDLYQVNTDNYTDGIESDDSDHNGAWYQTFCNDSDTESCESEFFEYKKNILNYDVDQIFSQSLPDIIEADGTVHVASHGTVQENENTDTENDIDDDTKKDIDDDTDETDPSLQKEDEFIENCLTSQVKNAGEERSTASWLHDDTTDTIKKSPHFSSLDQFTQQYNGLHMTDAHYSEEKPIKWIDGAIDDTHDYQPEELPSLVKNIKLLYHRRNTHKKISLPWYLKLRNQRRVVR